nr:hypothetical protein [uncultured Sphingobacterium sp.]
MNKKADTLNAYKKFLAEERTEELAKNSTLIEEFINFCKTKQIQLTIDNFDYVQTTGIIAYYPNLVHLLNDVIAKDKEELVEVSMLEKEYKKETFAAGFYYSDKYMVMAHPYFRRGHNERNNFAPRFLDIFWGYEKENIQKYIAIDSDRVRVNVDNSMYMEFDTWYGAKFKETVSDIEDDVVKLRPPLDLEPFYINSFFGDIYSLDIKWTKSKDGIKIFQAEEFKVEQCRILKNGKEYYPVKYLHAEFDSEIGAFRHFDGAIHFYTEEEYYQRRDDDLNYNIKNSFQLKTLSQKLFKVNGVVTTEEWIELVSHYLTGNPLIFEYFEGKLPDNITEIIDILRKIPEE